MLYLDASALAKLYITEPGGSQMPGVIREHRDAVFTSIVTYAETLSVLARSMRERRISPREYQVAKKAFLADWPAWHVIEVTQTVLAPAARLPRRPRPPRRFRPAPPSASPRHPAAAAWRPPPSRALSPAPWRRAAGRAGSCGGAG